MRNVTPDHELWRGCGPNLDMATTKIHKPDPRIELTYKHNAQKANRDTLKRYVTLLSLSR